MWAVLIVRDAESISMGSSVHFHPISKFEQLSLNAVCSHRLIRVVVIRIPNLVAADHLAV